MTITTLTKSLNFIESTKCKVLNISGGELTEHPAVFNWLEIIRNRLPNVLITLLTNGTFLLNEIKVYEINQVYKNGFFNMMQITSTKEYYKSYEKVIRNIAKLDFCNDEHVFSIYTGDINITPIGRGKNIELSKLCTKSPLCSNVQLIIKQKPKINIVELINILENAGQFCKPTILWNGNIVAGETTNCNVISTVNDDVKVFISNLKNKSFCNKCGLVKNINIIAKQILNIN